MKCDWNLCRSEADPQLSIHLGDENWHRQCSFHATHCVCGTEVPLNYIECSDGHLYLNVAICDACEDRRGDEEAQKAGFRNFAHLNWQLDQIGEAGAPFKLKRVK